MILTHTEIRQLRRELGVTQAGLAEQLDVTAQAVRNWEAGRRECSGPAAVLMVFLHGISEAANNAKPVPARPKYADLAAGDWAAAAEYDWCELKYDGHYGELVGGPDGWELRSRGGHLVDSGREALPKCHLLVEHITGTEWAENDAPAGLRGGLAAWSALGPGGQHLSEGALRRLVVDINEQVPVVIISDRWPMMRAEEMWAKLVERDGWEGLIFRTHDGRFARMKHRVTADFVFTAIEGDSLIGSLYNSRGKLIDKVRVPLPHSVPIFIGQVFEVSGMGITQRGSVRNPRFERWRPEKAAEECTT